MERRDGISVIGLCGRWSPAELAREAGYLPGMGSFSSRGEVFGRIDMVIYIDSRGPSDFGYRLALSLGYSLGIWFFWWIVADHTIFDSLFVVNTLVTLLSSILSL